MLQVRLATDPESIFKFAGESGLLTKRYVLDVNEVFRLVRKSRLSFYLTWCYLMCASILSQSAYFFKTFLSGLCRVVILSHLESYQP